MIEHLPSEPATVVILRAFLLPGLHRLLECLVQLCLVGALEVQLAALVLLVMKPDLICIHVHLVLAHTVSELHRIRVTELLSPYCHDTEAFVLEGGEE